MMGLWLAYGWPMVGQMPICGGLRVNLWWAYGWPMVGLWWAKCPSVVGNLRCTLPAGS